MTTQTKMALFNIKDLRRLYLFNINGERKKALIPEEYSVFKSEYDSDNDFMFVFAQLDSNSNGKWLRILTGCKYRLLF